MGKAVKKGPGASPALVCCHYNGGPSGASWRLPVRLLEGRLGLGRSRQVGTEHLCSHKPCTEADSEPAWREEGGGRREEGVKVTLRGEGRGLEGREKKNEINSSVSHSGPSWLCVAFRAP